MQSLEPDAGASQQAARLESSPLYNEDLAPTTAEQRTWNAGDITALWIGMSVCVPTYMLASGMISGGMNWKQATLTVFLGNVIVLIPMLLNAIPGTRYGIPFPVLLRSSFGTLGSNIPALARGLVACGWFGIQTWVGGAALYTLVLAMLGRTPPEAGTADLPILGITGGEALAFFLFWLVNLVVIYKGLNWIKWLEKLSAPFLILMGLAMLWWAVSKAGMKEVFRDPAPLPAGEFWKLFVPSLTGVVGFWATLSLNIPDFSRYAKSQRSQIIGQTLGLPSTMTLYAFIGIAVTQATVVIFGEPIWDPVLLFQRFESGTIVVIAMIGLALATLSTNIAANVVSPANDLANLAPKYVSFRTGGLITAVVGVLMMPWKLIESTQGYVFTWLIAYGGLLGPIAGIMIADYFIVRRGELKVDALYDPHGAYRYRGGFNPVALGSLLLAVLPNIPGFVNAATGRAVFPGIFDSLYVWAWFIGFFLALIVYPVLMSIFQSGNGARTSAAPTP